MNNEETIKVLKPNILSMQLDLYRYGVEIDAVRTGEQLKYGSVKSFFISVPKSSHMVLDNGEEACGEALAKYAKKVIGDTYKNSAKEDLSKDHNETIVDLVVDASWNEDYFKLNYKERDEVWTREKEEYQTMVSMVAAMEIAKTINNF